MSAIAGVLGWPAANDPEMCCRRMLAAQQAFGPDSTGAWSGESIALGSALYCGLSERQADSQPLIGGGGRYVILADLRLDNREELLSRLGQSGPEFDRSADADILLAAWERWGEETLDLLNGDYAIAVWDEIERKLTLARDPFGQRPLFYHRQQRFFAFSSMPKGIHALAEVARAPDEQAIGLYLALVPEMSRTSYYRGIDQLPPGHVLSIKNGDLRLRRFWNVEPRELKLRSFDEYVEAFRENLDRAVRVRLRGAGDTVAAHLSCGWDSSAVVATAARQSGSSRDIHAFTSVPARTSPLCAPAFSIPDEGPIAAETAAIYPSVRHHQVGTTTKSPIEDLDLYVGLYDRPVYNLCNFAWIAEINRQASATGAAVLLNGRLGNFTISAGPYSILAEYIRRGRWREWMIEAGALARNKGMRRRGILASSFKPWIRADLWARLQRFSSAPDLPASALHPSLQRAVQEIRRERIVPPNGRTRTYVEQTLWAMDHYDVGNYRKGSLAGWGLDERDPTADRQLVEFCLSLPIDMLLKNGQRRPLAHAALSDRLPPAVLNERRKGIQAADWYISLGAHLPSIQNLLEEIAANPLAASVINIEQVRSWLREWPTGDWANPAILARYRGALPNALTAGHFILHASR
ncbi:MAG TPA: asparagine synthase-related protein [Allosphingosinicella sp.]|jgi:asparagine synthase (glutamine-hydrolysing)|uniref:asparagine synthetase B family protein n=1 Tax=Allosphingosinicella sp. TaxID=2823234 RepID=UPI002F277E6F